MKKFHSFFSTFVSSRRKTLFTSVATSWDTISVLTYPSEISLVYLLEAYSDLFAGDLQMSIERHVKFASGSWSRLKNFIKICHTLEVENFTKYTILLNLHSKSSCCILYRAEHRPVLCLQIRSLFRRRDHDVDLELLAMGLSHCARRGCFAVAKNIKATWRGWLRMTSNRRRARF